MLAPSRLRYDHGEVCADLRPLRQPPDGVSGRITPSRGVGPVAESRVSPLRSAMGRRCVALGLVTEREVAVGATVDDVLRSAGRLRAVSVAREGTLHALVVELASMSFALTSTVFAVIEAEVPEDSAESDTGRRSSLPDEPDIGDDAPIVGVCRLQACRGGGCWEVLAVDRGALVDLAAVLGFLNALLAREGARERYFTVASTGTEARVIHADRGAVRSAVEARVLELEHPDDAVGRALA